MNDLSIFSAAVLGIVEGITEFLPISSTGHLILTSKLMGLESTEFLKSFEIMIQLGAILAVVIMYWRTLVLDPRVLRRVAVAFLPTAVLGFLAYKIVKTYLLGNPAVVLWSLLIGGVAIIAFELWHKKRPEVQAGSGEISYRQAFWVGVFQSLAMIPGVSRSGATIIGGLLLGLNRKTIVEFSFLLAIPTMAAATGLDLIKSEFVFSSADLAVLAVGFVVSFVTAWAAVKFLLHYIQRHDFIAFGIYRIIFALVIWKFVA